MIPGSAILNWTAFTVALLVLRASSRQEILYARYMPKVMSCHPNFVDEV